MNTLEMTSLVWAGSLLAGFLGALTGLGGGVVIVPLLTLVFGVNIRYAIGASLISVIATSSGAAAAYVKEGYANMRIGILLEIATTLGALAGAAWPRGCRPRSWPSRSASCWPPRRFSRVGRAAPKIGRSSPIPWPLVCGSTAAIPAPMAM